MKILLVHNHYQSSSPSGEDGVFEAERRLLKSREKNINVITYEKYNDDIENIPTVKKIFLPLKIIWSYDTYRELKALIKREKPDVAHFHNIWYLISPSAYYACKECGVPVVQTLHNYRFFCINGLLMNGDSICESCIGRLPWRGMLYGCFRNSKLYSLPVALTDCFHKIAGTWSCKVDAYIALTEFGRKKFIECGLPEERIFVKPNFLANPPEPDYINNGYIIFLGRLSSEKGITVLIDAVKRLNLYKPTPLNLKIIGDGPLRKVIEEKIRSGRVDSIELLGRKNLNECMALLKESKFMVMPAVCYENFPLSIREAFACGKPVVASRLGAMAELIEDGKTGLLFEPGNPDDLAEKIKWMFDNEDACIEMGKNARAEFEAKYTADKNLNILMNIYSYALKKCTS